MQHGHETAWQLPVDVPQWAWFADPAYVCSFCVACALQVKVRINPAASAAASAAGTVPPITEAAAAGSSSVVHTIKHKPYLVGVHCDSPARQKLACWLGVAAYLACGWCLFHAERLAGATGKEHVYPKGYHKAVVQPHITQQQQQAAAAAAAAGSAASSSATAAAGAQQGAPAGVRVGEKCLRLSDA
jgi:hypothetical protein